MYHKIVYNKILYVCKRISLVTHKYFKTWLKCNNLDIFNSNWITTMTYNTISGKKIT